LEPGEIQVWLAGLDRHPSELATLAATLSPDERTRASRFRFERHRSHFICARGVLRAILSASLGVPPGSLVFEYGPRGKPFLANQSGPDGLQFNLSHSGGMALVALTRGVPVGVDIECEKREMEVDSIASRYFAQAEAAALTRLDQAARVRLFFRIWARKEAFIKALGQGMGIDLHSFEVPLNGEGVVRQYGAVDASYPAWYVRDLPPIEGFASAVVSPGVSAPALRCVLIP
jgi:4'-phosphopantetheinyl transferase